MIYNSTRNNSVAIESSQAIIKGLSSDGGLYVPGEIPAITLEEIQNFSGMSYNERAKFILGKFLTDFTAEEIECCVNSAYTKEKFKTESIAPVYKLNSNTYILELWHGPTCAFKDMALQILPHLLVTSLKKNSVDKEIVILVATSGDTGKAALEGFADVEGTRINVFYPNDGVSNIQKLQMVTQSGNNVNVTAVNGNFDDAQNGVKTIFTDEQFQSFVNRHGFMLSSANSINWGRLVPQIVYYFSGYADLIKTNEIKAGEKINIVVPTGNFGNILAAYYAFMMGLPVNKFICASNSNNVLTDFINTGKYNKNRDFNLTISPSMDILISSNLERFLYQLSDRNDKLIEEYMNQLKTTGEYEVSDDIKSKISELFYGNFADDSETRATIKSVNDNYSYLMDTHTAVAQCVYEKYVAETGDKTKTIVASTASPFKFSRSVIQAVKADLSYAESDNEFDVLNELSEISHEEIPASLSELKTKPILFDTVCNKTDLADVVKEFLGV